MCSYMSISSYSPLATGGTHNNLPSSVFGCKGERELKDIDESLVTRAVLENPLVSTTPCYRTHLCMYGWVATNI